MDTSKIAIQIASEFTGSKAFKAAESSTQKLTRSVKNLARSLGIAFGSAAIINYSKQAIKAFAADENAARSLGMTLKNLNLDYVGASDSVNQYISNLEKQTGILDDELRPAMDRFLRATSSITESQKLLNLALDISAGTGKDLTAVSQGLQKAYLGNNASLGRLGVGLTKAELKSNSFLVIQEKLTALFAGQAQSAADSYLGSINKLTVASNNAKEIIGKDLVDSLALLSGPDGISKSTQQMEDLASAIGDTVYGLAVLIDKLKELPLGNAILQTLGDVLGNLQPFAWLRGLGRQNKPTPAQSPGQRAEIDRINKEALKFQKQKNTLLQIENKDTVTKLKLTAGQQALEELKQKFDVERIGLYEALNKATDKETEGRILSLIAIKNNDEALALKIKAEQEAAEQARLLAAALAASLAKWGQWQSVIGDAFKNQALTNQMPPSTQPQATYIPPSYGYAPGDIPGLSGTRGFSMAGASGDTYIINASGIGDQQIASVVQGALQDLNRYGSSTTFAGALGV